MPDLVATDHSSSTTCLTGICAGSSILVATGARALSDLGALANRSRWAAWGGLAEEEAEEEFDSDDEDDEDDEDDDEDFDDDEFLDDEDDEDDEDFDEDDDDEGP